MISNTISQSYLTFILKYTIVSSTTNKEVEMIRLIRRRIIRSSKGTDLTILPEQELSDDEALKQLRVELEDKDTQIICRKNESVFLKKKYKYLGIISCEDILVFMGSWQKIQPLLEITEKHLLAKHK